MNQITRKYNCKDVEMIIASSTIIEAAIKNKDFLQGKRSNWKDPYFEDIKEGIDAVTKECLGMDNAAALRKATQLIIGIQKDAGNLLAEVKVQIEVDFNTDKVKRDEILNLLGYKAYHKQVQNDSQEALIQMLFHFKTNLSAELLKEIVQKGTSESTLKKLMGYADILKNAEISQESNKGEKQSVTGANIEAFNDIYEKIAGICKISYSFFKGKPVVQSQFSFSRVVKTLSSHSGNALDDDTPEA